MRTRRRLVYAIVTVALVVPTAAIATGRVSVSISAAKSRVPRIFACYGGKGNVVNLLAGRTPKCPAGAKVLSWDAGTTASPSGLIYSGHTMGAQPPDTTGNVGDFFLDLDTYQLWGPKLAAAAGATWANADHTVLKGPAGANGTNGQAGQNGQNGTPGTPGVSGYNTNTVTQTVAVGTANLTVGCNQGSPLGGGEDNSAGGDVVLLKSFPSGNGWTVAVHNGSTNNTSHQVTAWVVCANVS
jgi:hypothetical protein